MPRDEGARAVPALGWSRFELQRRECLVLLAGYTAYLAVLFR